MLKFAGLLVLFILNIYWERRLVQADCEQQAKLPRRFPSSFFSVFADWDRVSLFSAPVLGLDEEWEMFSDP